MYCKKCGDVLDSSNTSEISDGQHKFCGATFRFCTYCGNQESKDNFHYQYNNYVFCQASVKDCAKLFFEQQKDDSFKEYESIFPKFNDELKDVFLNLKYEDDDFDEEEFIEDVNTFDGYIVIYNDSDGHCWYKKVPNNLDVLKYVIKSEHRVTLGMGCNQYVHCVIYNGEEFDIEIR